MANLDTQTLTTLRKLGVEFVISVPTVSGQMSYPASIEELSELADDPLALYAKALGVTRQQYQNWIEDDGMVFCSATTLAGRLCRNTVINGYSTRAKQWVELQGGYCTIHGEGRDRTYVGVEI